MDLDRVMSMYSPDIVSFDVEPPLQHIGAEAKRRNWANVFAMYHCPLDYQVQDLAIAVADDVGYGHGFVRISGTLKSGTKAERWLRSTLIHGSGRRITREQSAMKSR